MSENCSNHCSSCAETCSDRQSARTDFLEPANANSHIKKVIGVVSGKGGVGKSFVTSYLTVLFQRKGKNTAILDADITGPSIPKAFGIHEKAMANELGILPVVTQKGTKIMSVNLLLDTEETPVIWRGPVIAGTVKQFWSEVVWEDIDYMFVDMPPGTGDVPLTVFQSLPLDGIVIVTSPQDLVSLIVKKAVNMANAMDIPILGIVENYSYMKCSNCEEILNVFGESKVDGIAAEYGVPVLARLPIDPKIAKIMDQGKIEELDEDWMDEAVENLERMLSKEQERTSKLSAIKIAITTGDNNEVFPHFGKCEKFTVFETSDSRILGKTTLSSAGNGHAALGELLKKEGIDILICGGIGEGAMNILKAAGIGVVSGAVGDVDKVIIDFFTGNLKTGTEANCNHHKEDENCCKEKEDCCCHSQDK